jgi:hypothetical protein
MLKNDCMRKRTCNGFTRLELIIVASVLAAITILGLATRSDNGRARAKRIQCVSNLKQIGLGFRMWSNDHGEKFPWEVSTNDGGTVQYSGSADVWRHFQAASNELDSPKILACPADASRQRTPRWDGLRNSNISYFVLMNIERAKPARVLAGDRFVSTNNKVVSGLLVTSDARKLRWVRGGHDQAGNVALMDGSVNQVSTDDLRAAFSNQTVRLAIP